MKSRVTLLCFAALATANRYAAEAGALLVCGVKSKTGPRRKAGLLCECRAPSLARKDGLCSSAE